MPPINREKFREFLTEQRLRTALASMLHKLGLIGDAQPRDSTLIRLAEDWVKNEKTLVDDAGNVYRFEDCLAPPNPKIDGDIPF